MICIFYVMHKKSKQAHWTTTYLKRINSTEVTIKRDKKKEKRARQTETEAAQELEEIGRLLQRQFLPSGKDDGQTQARETGGKRTPERDKIVYTPIREAYLVSPGRNICIPPTPRSEMEGYQMIWSSSKRRLW